METQTQRQTQTHTQKQADKRASKQTHRQTKAQQKQNKEVKRMFELAQKQTKAEIVKNKFNWITVQKIADVDGTGRNILPSRRGGFTTLSIIRKEVRELNLIILANPEKYIYNSHLNRQKDATDNPRKIYQNDHHENLAINQTTRHKKNQEQNCLRMKNSTGPNTILGL